MNKKYIPYLLILILFVWVAALTFSKNENAAGVTTVVEENRVSGFSTDLTRIAEEHENETVIVSASRNLLSGFIYQQDGDTIYIVTCYHGVADASMISVTLGNTYELRAELLGYDPYTDIAVLKTETPYLVDTVKIGDSLLLNKGEFVLSIGTPQSSDYAMSCELGMISLDSLFLDNSITYNEESRDYYLNVVQYSSSISEGYSGSPLYNMNGEVVGVTCMEDGDSKFAVTANELKLVADKIIQNGHSQRIDLGIKGVFVKDMANYEKSASGITLDTTSGFYITDIRTGSLSERAGLHVHDIVATINDATISDLDDYLYVIYSESESLAFTLDDSSVFTIGVNND